MKKQYMRELIIGMQDHRGGRSDKLDGMDVLEEYNIIMNKNSRESSAIRKLVVDRVELAKKLYPEYAEKRDAEEKAAKEKAKVETDAS